MLREVGMGLVAVGVAGGLVLLVISGPVKGSLADLTGRAVKAGLRRWRDR